MDPSTEQLLDACAKWLQDLADDAVALASLLNAESIPESARRYVAGSLNYLWKSLDLIPDGVEDLGYLDDAFVMRVAAKLAIDEAPAAREADIRGLLARLADEAAVAKQVLGDDYGRLAKYVRSLQKGAARGRTVDEVVTNPAERAALVRDVHGWAKQYAVPAFHRDEKNLIKLRSFLSSKLPA